MATYEVRYALGDDAPILTFQAEDYSEGDNFGEFYDGDGDLVFAVAIGRLIYVRVHHTDAASETVVNPTEGENPLPALTAA